MDERIRLAAFNWLTKQTFFHGDVLPREILAQGFEFEGRRVPLLGPSGIFKPQILELPLSITTSPNSPYNDMPDEDGNWLYKYRGTDPNHRDNVGLREAMRRKAPLIYFIGLRPGRYMTTYPVFIVEDHIEELAFKVVADNNVQFNDEGQENSEKDNTRRRYITANVRVRLHQREFREKVVFAYQEQCACCRLRHLELLDAAHITPDPDPEGEPIVSNGISLCKLHHAAFDSNILGIRPDYVIEINRDILEEEDGPMLKHGLQGLHRERIILPRLKRLFPDQKRLEARYEEFINN